MLTRLVSCCVADNHARVKPSTFNLLVEPASGSNLQVGAEACCKDAIMLELLETSS